MLFAMTLCWQSTATSCVSENTPCSRPCVHVHVWDREEELRGLRPKCETVWVHVSLCAFADSIKQRASLIDVAHCPHTVTGRAAVPLWRFCVRVCVCVCSACVGVCDRERNWPSTSWLYLLCWAQRFTVTPLSCVLPALRQKKRDCLVLLYSFSVYEYCKTHL